MSKWMLRIVLFMAMIISSGFTLNTRNNVASAAICEQLINTGFEETVVASDYRVVDAGLLPGWATTATDNKIEQWKSGFESVVAYEGKQFVELNANEIAALYQDFKSVPGTTLTVTFAHRGRKAVDEAVLEMGVPGQTLTTVANMSTGGDAWKVYTATYTVPDNQTITRIQFRSTKGTNGGFGNFLDGISITRDTETCAPLQSMLLPVPN
jgi:hypothetical protein